MVMFKNRLFEFWGFVEPFFFIIFCCFSVWVYYTHIQLWCPHFIAAAIGCFRYFTCLKFLSPNIHIQILLIDFHAFPWRINWESLVKHQIVFFLWWWCMNIVRWKLMLVTCVTQKGLKSQQDEWVFYLSLLLLNPWMKSYDVTIN